MRAANPKQKGTKEGSGLVFVERFDSRESWFFAPLAKKRWHPDLRETWRVYRGRTGCVCVASGVSEASMFTCVARNPSAGVVNPTDGAGEFPSCVSCAVRSESRLF